MNQTGWIYIVYVLLGKAKSNAKTELEKLKMKEMTCAELIKETTVLRPIKTE